MYVRIRVNSNYEKVSKCNENPISVLEIVQTVPVHLVLNQTDTHCLLGSIIPKLIYSKRKDTLLRRKVGHS